MFLQDVRGFFFPTRKVKYLSDFKFILRNVVAERGLKAVDAT